MIRESLFFVIKFDFASCCQKPFLAFQNEVVIIELLDHAVPGRVFIYLFIYTLFKVEQLFYPRVFQVKH